MLGFGYRKYPNGYRGFSWEGIFRLPAAAYCLDGDLGGSVDDGEGSFSLARFAVLRDLDGSSSRRGKCGASVHQIDFFRCDLGDSRTCEKMERYVAERFSNPAIILFGDFNGACISAVWAGDPSPEHGVFAAAPFVSTGVFYPGDEALAPFLDALSFDGIPKGNLRAYFEEVDRNILLSKIVPLLGGFPDCCGADTARLAELVAKRDSLSKELWDVGRSLRSGKSLARGDRIALEEKRLRLKQQDDLVVRQIKQLCG